MTRPPFLPARRRLALAGLLALCGGRSATAAEPTQLKIATIAPKGSLYHRVMQDLGEAFRTARGAQARYTVYPDGIQGSEADMVRRMRVGQLDAALLTVVGLADIDPVVTALQFMPMVFQSWEEVDHVREQLRPVLEEKLAARGFVVLFWGDAGWVRFFSRDPMTTPEQFKRARVFAWSGDNAQVGLMKSMGYQPVPLPVSDILPALETGMLDAVPVIPAWALVGQFDRIARHRLPVRWVPIVGAAVIRKATFDALGAPARDALLAAARQAEAQLRVHRVTYDEESIAALKARGLVVAADSPELRRAWQTVAEQAWPQVRGSLVPADMFDRVQSILRDYRAKKRS